MIEGLGLSASGMKLFGDKKHQLKEACHEVESLFLYMMLKEMEKTVSRTDLFGDNSNAQNIYRDIKNIELARGLANRSVLGLSKILYKSMEKFV